MSVEPRIENCFALEFEFEMPAELPSGTRYYFPGASTEGGKDGVLVRFVLPDGPSWVGVFAFGHNGRGCVTVAMTTPNPWQLCVVADGDGYLVDARDPESCKPMRAVPVRFAQAVIEQRLLILADDTTIVAYGESGIAWETDRVAWSTFTIKSISDSVIHCETYDIRSEEDIEFTVDLRTGKRTGGIEVI